MSQSSFPTHIHSTDTTQPTSPLPMVTYHVPSTTVDLVFYNYHRTISISNTNYCVLAAIQDCLDRIDDWDQLMGPNSKFYSSGSVTLSLYPEESMSWGSGVVAPEGLLGFSRCMRLWTCRFKLEPRERGRWGVDILQPWTRT